MKIITLHQPWASLVALGLKRYETRHWPTSYRGALLIHAAKRKMNETELCLLTKDLPMDEAIELTEAIDRIEEDPCYGCIVGGASLIDCLKMSEELIDLQSPLEIAVGNWKVGRFGFKLQNPVQFPDPISFTSRQGKLLDAPVEIVAAVRAQLKGVA